MKWNESMSCMLWVCDWDCNDMTCEFHVQFTRASRVSLHFHYCVCVRAATWQSQSKNTINQHLVCSHFALWKPIFVFLFQMQPKAHNRFTLKLFHFQNTHNRIQWILILLSENFIPFKFHFKNVENVGFSFAGKLKHFSFSFSCITSMATKITDRIPSGWNGGSRQSPEYNFGDESKMLPKKP